jgi:hypothetical protein
MEHQYPSALAHVTLHDEITLFSGDGHSVDRNILVTKHQEEQTSSFQNNQEHHQVSRNMVGNKQTIRITHWPVVSKVFVQWRARQR